MFKLRVCFGTSSIMKEQFFSSTSKTVGKLYTCMSTTKNHYVFQWILYIKILFEMNIFCEYQRRNSWLCPIFIAGYCRDVLITILFRETKLYTNFLSRFSKWQHLIQVLVILQLQRNATWFTTELHKQITFRKISRISFRIYEKQLPLE